MDCRQTDENLFSYCDDQISPEKRVLIDGHLKECQLCQTKLELTIRENEVLTDMEKLPELPDDFTSMLMNDIRLRSNQVIDGKKSLLSKISSKRSFVFIFSTAAIIALLFIVIPDLSVIKPEHNIADNNQGQIIDENKLHRENAKTAEKPPLESEKPNSWQRENAIMKPDDAVAKDYQVADIAKEGLRSDKEGLAIFGDNSRSIKKAVCADEDLDQTSRNKIPHLQPENIPANFRLANIISEIDDTLTFIYRDNTTANDLIITVKSAPDSAPLLQRNFSIPDPEKAEIPSGNHQKPEVNIDQSLIKKEIDYSNNSYTIIINSQLPAHELADIVSSIEFREVK